MGRRFLAAGSGLALLAFAWTGCSARRSRQGSKGDEAPAGGERPGIAISGEIDINPNSPDAAERLAAALQKGGVAIRISPGVIEGEFTITRDAVVRGSPEDPTKTALRVSAPGGTALTVAEGVTLKASGLKFSAKMEAKDSTGISLRGKGYVEATACRFEGPLSRGLAVEEGEAVITRSTFLRLRGSAVTAARAKLSVSGAEFNDIDGKAIEAKDSDVRVENVRVAYLEEGGVVTGGGDVTVSSSTFENCSPSGISLVRAEKAVVTGCTVKDTTKGGILVHDCRTAEVSGNHCENPRAAAIWVRGPVKVEKNVIRSDDKGVGVRVQGRGAVVAKNRIDHLKVAIGARGTKDLRVEGNRIRWGWCGIMVYESGSPLVSKNSVEAVSKRGIVLSADTSAVAEDNTLASLPEGIVVLGGDAIVRRNTVQDPSENGIAFEQDASVEAYQNRISGRNAAAFAVRGGSSRVYENVSEGLGSDFMKARRFSVHDNTVTGSVVGAGLYFSACSGGVVYGNKVSKGHESGIYVGNCSDTDVYSNEVFECKWKGIWVEGGWNFKLFDNKVHHNREYGIYVLRAKNAVCHSNLIHDNEIALRYNESSGEVRDNVCHDNEEAIIFWQNASVHSHHNECFDNNSEGILYRGSHGESHHNNLHDNEWGMYLKSSRGEKIIVHDNELCGNERAGVRIEWGAICEIYHNRMVGNGRYGVRIRPKSPVELRENYIAENDRFGVLAWEENEVTLTRNVIVRNGYTGICAGANKSFLADHNTILGNLLGGVWVYGGGTATLEANIIYRNEQSGVNTRPAGKEGEHITGEGTATLRRNLIFANGTDLVGAEDDGTNIFADPQLEDLEAGNFRPKPGSPAVTQEGVIGALSPEEEPGVPFDPIPGAGPRREVPAAGERPAPEEEREEDAF